MRWLFIAALAVIVIDIVVLAQAREVSRSRSLLTQAAVLGVVSVVLLGALWSVTAAAVVALAGALLLAEMVLVSADR